MKRISAFALGILYAAVMAGQVGINTGNASPDPSAGLDVNFDNKGVLVPRLTQSERDAIVNPAYGLIILNTTTDCINLYIGGWRQMCSECDFAPPTASNNGPVCTGGSLQLTASTISGATYSWTGPGGFTSAQQNPVIANAGIGSSGQYTVTASLGGCTSSGINTFVNIAVPPSAPVAGSNGPLCEGDELLLTSSMVSGATYVWSGPDGFTASVQNPSISSVTPASQGLYSVVASVSGCVSSPGQVSVMVNDAPAVPGNISGNSVVCANSLNEIYSIQPVSGADDYTWTVPSGASIASGQGTLSIAVDYTSASGNMCVTSNGVCGSSAPSCLAISAGLFNTSQLFMYTGSDQSFVVPPAVTALQIKSWGGGGGGGSTGYLGASYNTGGPGGYAGGVITVTPGETLTVRVAQGGNYVCNGDCSGSTTGTVYPGGGAASEGNGGGGYSGVFRNATPLVIAGGGGGGGAGANNNQKRGGAGGGTTAQDGDSGASGGKGGTSSSGGQGGTGLAPQANGSYLTGANGYYGGGGGGGYYGGGGGNWAGSWQHMGGGGGSSYVDPSALCPQNLMGDKASPSSVPNSGDVDYSGGIGTGGQQSSGGLGRVILRW
jgi:hypothetical protein